ncbi:hypothetical protein GNIT_1132 [Glaciecola nitratireducens FR1064]|uniref:Uncharacterized protein n=1 Tax=Glaciecola nitratireducens (strain JCM 12485 / KCTC 12276 / FR1064) TaxID=1085623 RepID=G4QG97_GLANF|nr:hypothetical protein GNIT_1132 [Glaciecola nitratireducens FR1064]
MQFNLNLFLTEANDKTNSNCPKTSCSCEPANYCLAASLEQSAHSTESNKVFKSFLQLFL